MGDDVHPHHHLCLHPAVPVLLDGGDVTQAGCGTVVAHRQSVLDHQADAGALREIAVSHAIPVVALEHHRGVGDIDRPVAGGLGTGCLCHRAAEVPASARPMETFGGSDDESMAANNTSAFNDRTIAGTSFSSLHAYGAAIDVNPVQNPYVSRTRAKISPPDGARFVSRTPPQPGMVEAIITVFATHGFTIWGGAWRDPKDYQHFQIDQRLAERLARLSKKEAFRVYDHYKKNKTR